MTEHKSLDTRSWEFWLMAVIAVASLLFSGGWVLHEDRTDVSERVTTLEAQRASDQQRLERIENKLDRLLERKP